MDEARELSKASNIEDQWIGKYFYLVFKGLLDVPT
jgi:hypothetical protein